MTPLLHPLATFAVQTKIRDIPSDVQKVAVEALTDYVAVAMAGAQTTTAQNALKYVRLRRSPGARCVLFGQNEKSNAEMAAFFNGTASYALDYDDVSWTTIGHPTVSVAPAAIACVQEMNGDGGGLLQAYVVGVEVMHQIARWTMPQLSESGWHTTPVYGVFGAATAACRVSGATVEQTVNALAIAASRAAGLRANFGTQTKALHAGLSAMAGIECARLALCGITGNHAVIEAADGFAQCFIGAKLKDKPVVDIGRLWDLTEAGLVFKQYPCCSGSHPSNDVWDAFLKTHPIRIDDIEHIHAGVSLLGPRELNCHLPQNAIEAKFSLEFALAARVVYGALNVEAFTNEKVQDPRIQALMRRIEMEVDPELAKLGFIGTAPVRMLVRLKDGRTFRLENDLAQGNPQKPLSPDQRKKKFDSCLRVSACPHKTQDWWNLMANLKTVSAKKIACLGL